MDHRMMLQTCIKSLIIYKACKHQFMVSL